MIAAADHWPLGSALPCALDVCRALLEASDDDLVPTGEEVKHFVRELLANWPWLNQTKQDLRVYMLNCARVYASYSRAAGVASLHPVEGVVAAAGNHPPSVATLNGWLANFDQTRARAKISAERVLAEERRRREQLETERRIAQERSSFTERHGKSPVEFARERLGR